MVFGAKQSFAAAGEAVITTFIFGSYLKGLPVTRAQTFFGQERLPQGWTRPILPITLLQLTPIITYVSTQCGHY